MAKIIKTTDATGKLVEKRVVSLNIVERHDVIKELQHAGRFAEGRG